MISNIVVTDDGAETSDKAIVEASELAKHMNVKLTLLHVIDDIEIPASLILGNNRVVIERAQRSIGKALEKGWNQRAKTIMNKLMKDDNIASIDSKCLNGVASEQILEFIDSNKVDMVVMGSSRRLKGVSKIRALGSVTRNVSELARCPVLIIH
ncbi:MAG: universal stress protein [Thermoproteota archaeon]|nr:universal stress protein [Nitrosopumilus sp.]MDQ3084195.1 universal stress protein [Thermoproteota archaeon]